MKYKLWDSIGTYTGWIFDEEPNGQGSFLENDGYEWIGQWEDGLLNGYMRKIYPNGSIEEAIWKDG